MQPTKNKAAIQSRAILLLTTILLTCNAGAGTNEQAPKDLNTRREFPVIRTVDEWKLRAEAIKNQVLISCGLWPMSRREPPKFRIFDRVEQDGYTVEKVWVETLPGLYLGGNLYRPIGTGPFPAILNPHGHWKEGRLTDSPEGSVPARCISFARQGIVAFTYDMLGYNDTRLAGQSTNMPLYNAHRQFGTNSTDLLWNISLMGVQTWNSLRALDFLEALKGVDRKRLGVTGASGGGTQSFMLGAFDERLAAQAPIVMVSHSMQGGCSCENAPGLRVQYSNMEIAAAAAPRPQVLVGATGDWTRATLTIEGPALARIYSLFGAREHLGYDLLNYGHNYNQETREAVYEFFGRWLSDNPNPRGLKETPYNKLNDSQLRVFPDGTLPEGALTHAELTDYLKRNHLRNWKSRLPMNARSLRDFKATYMPAWRHTLQLPDTTQGVEVQTTPVGTNDGMLVSELKILKRDNSGKITARLFRSHTAADPGDPELVVVLCGGSAAGSDEINEVVGPQVSAIVIEHFATDLDTEIDQFANFYCTYNRTVLQDRVTDIVMTCMAARGLGKHAGNRRVILAGDGLAGIYSLLAAPAADAVIADANSIDWSKEETWLEREYYCPGILASGGHELGVMLSAPNPLVIYNTGNVSRFPSLASAYKSKDTSGRFTCESGKVGLRTALRWVSASFQSEKVR